MATLQARLNALATGIGNYIRDSVLPRVLPAGGNTGQVLAKISNVNYIAGWVDVAATTIGFSSVELDLGTPASRSGIVNITGLPGLTIGKPVQLWLAPGPYSGKGFSSPDEVQMYDIIATGRVTSATTITVWWRSTNRVRGNVKFNYLIGA